MLATGLKYGENHQIRVREEPLFGFGASGLGNARQSAQVLISGEASQVIQTDAGEGGDFVFGKDLLARFDSYHNSLTH